MKRGIKGDRIHIVSVCDGHPEIDIGVTRGARAVLDPMRGLGSGAGNRRSVICLVSKTVPNGRTDRGCGAAAAADAAAREMSSWTARTQLIAAHR